MNEDVDISFDSEVYDEFAVDANMIESILSGIMPSGSAILNGDLLGSGINSLTSAMNKVGNQMGKTAKNVQNQKEAMIALELALAKQAEDIKIYDDYELKNADITYDYQMRLSPVEHAQQLDIAFDVDRDISSFSDFAEVIKKDISNINKGSTDISKILEIYNTEKQDLLEVAAKDINKSMHNNSIYDIAEQAINDINKTETRSTTSREISDLEKLKLEDVLNWEESDAMDDKYYLFDDFYYEEPKSVAISNINNNNYAPSEMKEILSNYTSINQRISDLKSSGTPVFQDSQSTGNYTTVSPGIRDVKISGAPVYQESQNTGSYTSANRSISDLKTQNVAVDHNTQGVYDVVEKTISGLKTVGASNSAVIEDYDVKKQIIDKINRPDDINSL